MAVTATRGVTATDKVMLAYLALNTTVVLLRARALPHWPWLVVANLLATALIALLARLEQPRGFTRFVAGAWPIVLTLGYYAQLGLINEGAVSVRDHIVSGWEMAVFGTEPSVTWHEAMPSLLLSWVLHVAYISYYWVVPVAALLLFFRTDERSFTRGAFIITLGFYVCYAIYHFFPVAGPRYIYGDATGPIAEVLPARIIKALMQDGSSWGTAFPSSHVVACLSAVWALWRPARRAALALAPFAVLLIPATVFGQFHYAVDAMAGTALAMLLLAVADPLRRLLEPSA